MSSNFQTWEGVLGLQSARVPYVSGIPPQILQGDSVTWNDNSFVDVNGVAYDSAGYTLQYVFAGPISAPLVVAAAASGVGWSTTLTSTQTATLKAGKYWWMAQALTTGKRVTIAQGELTVNPDLAAVGANYDGRTQAEIALEQALAAYATFSNTGGRVKAYTIGHRSMTFDTLADVQVCVDFWRKRVVVEKSRANGSRDRSIHVRFDRTR
jgi:hypothetical protein